VFLTPIAASQLLELHEPECACKQFLQINYQMLLEDVLEPCQKELKPGSAAELLTQYIQVLGYSHERGIPIMALPKQYREELREFWNRNKNVFRQIALSLKDDPDFNQEEQSAVRQLEKGSGEPIVFVQKFKEQFPKAFTDSEWICNGKDRSLSIEFKPFKEFLKKKTTKTRITRLVFYLGEYERMNERGMYMNLQFIGGGQNDLNDETSKWVKSIREVIDAAVKREPEIEGKQSQGINIWSWVFIYGKNEEDAQVENVVKTIGKLDPAIHAWFKRSFEKS
jgi:hypothetical protein